MKLFKIVFNNIKQFNIDKKTMRLIVIKINRYKNIKKNLNKNLSFFNYYIKLSGDQLTKTLINVIEVK